MSVRVAINGFGRIGRNVLRSAKKAGKNDIDFVAVNDLTDNATLAHLLKYDSVHGHYPGTVDTFEGGLRVDGDDLRVFSERDPAALPWADLGVDIVTIGQYLRPTPRHRPIHRYVEPAEFARYRASGEHLGLGHVEAGPLVRSSYHARDSLAAAAL